jgi:septum formation protein
MRLPLHPHRARAASSPVNFYGMTRPLPYTMPKQCRAWFFNETVCFGTIEKGKAGSLRMTTKKPCTDVRLILASASPRRKDLLGRLGICFEVVPSRVDEVLENGEKPEEHVRRLARAKAEEVAKQYPDRWVLGADTIVVIDDTILGKPGDETEARSMLARLHARFHRVLTGYALLNASRPELETVRCVASSVYIRELSAEEIAGYVKSGEPMDKAGSYAIQGLGSGIVERVTGSYTNVVGLPLCEVARDLKALGIFDFLGSDQRS